jgi:CubicO group peptidase (beta-lactamase class C family)
MKRFIPLGFFIVVLTGFAIQSSIAQTKPISAKQIDSLTNLVLQTFNVPGIAVGVVKDGKLIYAKGHGIANVATGKKVDENTLFGVASNSKAITVAALGILVDEGKIKWDDKVTDYIPE